MTTMVVPALGVIASLAGMLFLIGCFVRVDSPSFIERASGDEHKIERLRSLQAAWDALGRPRQFIASSSAYLIMGAGLLSVWRYPEFAKFYWLIPVAFLANLVGLLVVRKHANLALEKESVGSVEVLKVIRQNIRMCITFSVIYILVVTAV